MMRSFFRLLALFPFVTLHSAPLAAADWPQFRGPGGNAWSDSTGLPHELSDSTTLWKTELPGPGTSSPIVVGERIFLTCYTGYGLSRNNPGQQSDLERHLICLDRKGGGVLWKSPVKARLPEDQYRGFIADHGYSSSTPLSDGERVYVMFGKTGVLAFDLEGKQLWQADIGNGSGYNNWGSAASPVLYKDYVIVNASAEAEAIIALDKSSGKEAWKAAAGGFRGSWSTPVLVDVEGKQEVVVAVPGEIWALNPDTGKMIWYCEGIPGPPTSPSVISSKGIVYAVGGGRGPGKAVAIKAGGKGDVNSSHVLWSKTVGSYVTSPVLVEGHIYWISDRGTAYCIKADTGETVYEKRLSPSGQFYASVVAADGKLFGVSRFDGTFVLSAKPEFSQLGQNKLAGDETDFNASPAIVDGQILMRSNKYLYCFGKKQ